MTIRKIENRNDWDKFIADSKHFLGKVGNNAVGCFSVSQDGDNPHGYFFAAHGIEPESIFECLMEYLEFPFYLHDTDSIYNWF